jgi:hypothetical protein
VVVVVPVSLKGAVEYFDLLRRTVDQKHSLFGGRYWSSVKLQHSHDNRSKASPESRQRRAKGSAFADSATNYQRLETSHDQCRQHARVSQYLSANVTKMNQNDPFWNEYWDNDHLRLDTNSNMQSRLLCDSKLTKRQNLRAWSR